VIQFCKFKVIFIKLTISMCIRTVDISQDLQCKAVATDTQCQHIQGHNPLKIIHPDFQEDSICGYGWDRKLELFEHLSYQFKQN